MEVGIDEVFTLDICGCAGIMEYVRRKMRSGRRGAYLGAAVQRWVDESNGTRGVRAQAGQLLG